MNKLTAHTVYTLANIHTVDAQMVFLDTLDALGYGDRYEDSASGDTIIILSDAMAADQDVVAAFADANVTPVAS